MFLRLTTGVSERPSVTYDTTRNTDGKSPSVLFHLVCVYSSCDYEGRSSKVLDTRVKTLLSK